MSKRVIYKHKDPHCALFEIKLRRHPDYRIFVVSYRRLHTAAVFIQHRSLNDELTIQRYMSDEGPHWLSALILTYPRFTEYSQREMNKQLNFRVHMLARNQDEAVARLKRRRAYLGYCE